MRPMSLFTATALAIAALVPSAAATAAEAPVGPAAAQARAYAPAYNLKTMLVWFPSPVGALSCHTRAIDLDRGTYRWRTQDSQGIVASRNLDLVKGRYRWTDCIYHWERAGGYGVYYHKASLGLLGSSRPAAILEPNWLQHGTGWTEITYGSSLLRLR